MSKTIIDCEFPFGRVNGGALSATLVSTFDSITEDDISIIYNRPHPDSFSANHVVGLVFAIDSSNVSQTDVDTAFSALSDTLGFTVRLVGWGSYDPDYLEQQDAPI
jgi:hypothetical protein